MAYFSRMLFSMLLLASCSGASFQVNGQKDGAGDGSESGDAKANSTIQKEGGSGDATGQSGIKPEEQVAGSSQAGTNTNGGNSTAGSGSGNSTQTKVDIDELVNSVNQTSVEVVIGGIEPSILPQEIQNSSTVVKVSIVPESNDIVLPSGVKVDVYKPIAGCTPTQNGDATECMSNEVVDSAKSIESANVFTVVSKRKSWVYVSVVISGYSTSIAKVYTGDYDQINLVVKIRETSCQQATNYCGQKIECNAALECNPVYQTFDSLCELEGAGFEFKYEGVCK